MLNVVKREMHMVRPRLEVLRQDAPVSKADDDIAVLIGDVQVGVLSVDNFNITTASAASFGRVEVFGLDVSSREPYQHIAVVIGDVEVCGISVRDRRQVIDLFLHVRHPLVQ